MHKELNFELINKEPRISQYFYSLEGEGYVIGEPSLYLRLAGCYSAACKFCDTKFSWFEKNGKKHFYPLFTSFIKSEEIQNFFRKIDYKVRRLTITGGEPLHYMKNFHFMIRELLKYLNLNFLGIESNGNLLHKKENIILLSKILKKINHDFNILPMLTISPKLNPETCYPDSGITKDDVIEMYQYVYFNVVDYLDSKVNVNFKFIYGISEYDNNLVLQNINFLLSSIKYSRHKIFLMPFTPFDPLGKNKELWEKSKKETAEKALELGVRYSPRLHIDLNLD